MRSIQVPLRAPFVSATGAVHARELLEVELEDHRGVIGRGEAAPLPHYDGVGLADAAAAIEDCRELLASSDGEDIGGLLAACWQRAVLPQAVAGLDLALWDLAGQRAGAPVWRLLGAVSPPPVVVNATIAAADRAGASREAAAAVASGFACLKVKVGLGDDGARLAAVRAVAGPGVAIRIDANGAWSVSEALASLRLLAPIGLELCEEPVWGLDENRAVSAESPVPTAIDESSALAGALETRVSAAACLKISRSGGISGLIADAEKARRSGYEVYIASTLDGPRGIAGALHAASVLRPDRPCGLATLAQFVERSDALSPTAGTMLAPRGFGLGDGLSRWYDGRSMPSTEAPGS